MEMVPLTDTYECPMATDACHLEIPYIHGAVEHPEFSTLCRCTVHGIFAVITGADEAEACGA